MLELFLPKRINRGSNLVWNGRHIDSLAILRKTFAINCFHLLSVLGWVNILNILSPVWVYCLSGPNILFCIQTCIYSIWNSFSITNSTFPLSFRFRNLRIISNKRPMYSVRSKWVLSIRLNNCLCNCRLLNSRYLPKVFPSSSSCPRIFTSHIWLLVPFNNRIHFILWVIQICDRLCRLSIFFNLCWHLLIEKFRLTVLDELIFLALSCHEVLVKLLILYWLIIVFLKILHDHLIRILNVFFII